MRIFRSILAAALLALAAVPAQADFLFNPAGTSTAFDITCFTTKHCFASVNIDSAGAAHGVTGNPFFVTGSGGTFPATQSGTWTVQPGNTANSTAWLVTGTGGTFPVTGTITANAGTGNFVVTQGTAANLNATVVGTGTFAVQAAATLNAETTKVIGTVRNVGNIGGVFDFSGQNAASPANALLSGCQFNTSPTTITSGNASPCQVDNAGNLKVAIVSGGGSGGTASSFGAAFPATGTAIGVSNGANMVSPATGAGAVSTSVLRVTQGSDSPEIAALGAPADAVCGTATGSCSLIALQKFNNTSTAAGTAATGAAPPASVIWPGVNGSGATGGLMAGVIGCDNKAIYDASTSGSTELVALTSGRSIYICGYTILAGGTVNAKLIYGTGTACATGPNNLTPAWQLTAQVGLVDGGINWRGLKTASANALCINTSAGIAVQAIVYYSII